ncbi:MAG: type VI immunity family protein, partial [Burkholderia gladioli]
LATSPPRHLATSPPRHLATPPCVSSYDEPRPYGTITTRDRIKTVDWLTALDADFVRQVGGADQLMLPPDWFRKTPFGNSGLIIQAGPEPAAGVPIAKGVAPGAPVAYVLLNHALRPIVAETSDILQSGTVNSTAPLFNTRVATEAWLQRFNVPDDQLNGYWLELHRTPKLADTESTSSERR